jgi:hypothetical protein
MRRNADGSYCVEDIRAFQQAAKAFLGLIRSCNTDAQIIWCFGMLGIDFQQYIKEAVLSYAQEANDRKVSYLQLPCMTKDSVGSREHPGFLCHKQAAEVLAGYIAQLRN